MQLRTEEVLGAANRPRRIRTASAAALRRVNSVRTPHLAIRVDPVALDRRLPQLPGLVARPHAEGLRHELLDALGPCRGKVHGRHRGATDRNQVAALAAEQVQELLERDGVVHLGEAIENARVPPGVAAEHVHQHEREATALADVEDLAVPHLDVLPPPAPLLVRNDGELVAAVCSDPIAASRSDLQRARREPFYAARLLSIGSPASRHSGMPSVRRRAL